MMLLRLLWLLCFMLLAFLFLSRFRFCFLYRLRFLNCLDLLGYRFCTLLYSCSFLSWLLRLVCLGLGLFSLGLFWLYLFHLRLLRLNLVLSLLRLSATLLLLRRRLCGFLCDSRLLSLLCSRSLLDRLWLCRDLLHRCCLLFLRTASAFLPLRLFRSVFSVEVCLVINNCIDKFLLIHALVSFNVQFFRDGVELLQVHFY